MNIEGCYVYKNNYEKFEKFSEAIKYMAKKISENKEDKSYMAVGIDYVKDDGTAGSCDLIVKYNEKVRISNDYKTVLKDNIKELEDFLLAEKVS